MFLLFLFRLDWKVFICEFFPLGQGKEKKEKKGKFGAISIGFGVYVCVFSAILRSPQCWEYSPEGETLGIDILNKGLVNNSEALCRFGKIQS